MIDVNLLLSCIAWRDLWKKSHILHRDISSGNVLVGIDPKTSRPRGYPIDLDLAIKVDDLGKPIEDTPSSKHRTGTAPFMALDLLRKPKRRFPDWHLPRFDVESFIWVFCWTLHHFDAPRVSAHGAESERDWKEAPLFDGAFEIGETRWHLKASKLRWAKEAESAPSPIEIDPSFGSLIPLMWILLEQVVDAYNFEDTLVASKKPRKEEEFAILNGKLEVDNIIRIIEEFQTTEGLSISTVHI